MMAIFWDKYGTLLTEYLPGETRTRGSYYASIIEQLCCAIMEKHCGKVSDGVLLLLDYVKCNIAQAAIRKGDFVGLNHPAYSPAIALSDYPLFSSLKKFLRGKNFNRNDKTVDTVEDYLNNLELEAFCKGIESLRDRWQRVVTA